MLRVVLDTNVLVAGMRSSRGASFRLLHLVGESPAFRIALSVPLVFEYEDVLRRDQPTSGLSSEDVDDVLDYLCSVADLREVFFLWRPFLPDAGDDMVLELAVEADCDAIVTFNTKDFVGVEQFGLRTVTPREFLREIGEIG